MWVVETQERIIGPFYTQKAAEQCADGEDCEASVEPVSATYPGEEFFTAVAIPTPEGVEIKVYLGEAPRAISSGRSKGHNQVPVLAAIQALANTRWIRVIEENTGEE